MGSLTNALVRFVYMVNGWRVLDQRGSILVLRKRNITMMCHGLGTIYSISNNDDYYTNNYWDLFSALPGLYEAPKVLMIGLGGGTISRQISALYENAELDVIEIDKEIAELASIHFDMGRARVIVADGSEFVKKTDSRYDLIILDAFKGSKIPEEFTRGEFFANAYRILSKEGILAINSMDSVNPAKTLASGFKVYSLKSMLASGNSITICSKRKDAGQVKSRIAEMKISDNVKKAYAFLE